MTPERIAELRAMLDRVGYGSSMAVAKRELADLLATAEREANLREDVLKVVNWLKYLEGYTEHDAMADLESCLESKGGE